MAQQLWASLRTLWQPCGAGNAREKSRSTSSSSKTNGLTAGQQPSWLRITSGCYASYPRFAEPHRGLAKTCDWNTQQNSQDADQETDADNVHWKGFCACCKRPLTISLAQPPPAKRARGVESQSNNQFAFVVAVWGTNVEYVLGAMVLAHSLRRSGTRHDLVAMYTSDVPDGAVEILRRVGWKPHKVDYVEASDQLFHEQCLGMRFAQVFTKLHVFSLTNYHKVVMLDADLYVKENIDDLFDLPAPAAMGRGPYAGYDHGQRIDGSYFFLGHQHNFWCQSSGINAGVMLLEPSWETFKQCLAEVADPHHPEHIRGNGPEQDYLSRFFASDWRHIDVAYNFQLHQMYFALSPRCKTADRAKFMNHPELIKVFHYSSDPKPWARHLDQRYASCDEDAWLAEVKGTFSGYRAWVLQDMEDINKELEYSGKLGAAIAPDGRIRQKLWSYAGGQAWQGKENCASVPEEQDSSDEKAMYSEDGWLLGEVVEASKQDVQGCENITKLAVALWDQAFREIAEELGETDLAGTVKAAMTSKEETSTSIDSTHGPAATSSSEAAPSSEKHHSWVPTGGWWIERPIAGRVVASCGVLPQPYVLLSTNGDTILSSDSEGLHLAAVNGQDGAACPDPQSFAFSATTSRAAEWAAQVPTGATILLAIIDSSGTLCGEFLSALADAGLGCPSAAPPDGFVAMAAVGKKGETEWQSTHAAADVALSTGRL